MSDSGINGLRLTDNDQRPIINRGPGPAPISLFSNAEHAPVASDDGLSWTCECCVPAPRPFRRGDAGPTSRGADPWRYRLVLVPAGTMEQDDMEEAIGRATIAGGKDGWEFISRSQSGDASFAVLMRALAIDASGVTSTLRSTSTLTLGHRLGEVPATAS
jgi:hypothetical protein